MEWKEYDRKEQKENAADEAKGMRNDEPQGECFLQFMYSLFIQSIISMRNMKLID